MDKITLLLLSSIFCALPSYTAGHFFPGPFSTDGRWMVNEGGKQLALAGVNWPGAGDTMVPEGLQYASIADTIDKVKSIGMNVVRLTWAVEMVDDIIDKGGDKDIKTAFVDVLGSKNGTTIWQAVMKKNPSFSSNITRLQVFDAIAAECSKHQIYVHLDNHVSKAGWCCDKDDGNAWFGDEHFDIMKWKRALGYMADHGKGWSNLIGMALRNELRQPSFNWHRDLQVNWSTWYGNMTSGADAIHEANPDLLIFFSGLGFDSQLRPIFSDDVFGSDINFDKSKLAYGNKIVLEVHDYDMGESNCTRKEAKLTKNAFAALGPKSPQKVRSKLSSKKERGKAPTPVRIHDKPVQHTPAPRLPDSPRAHPENWTSGNIPSALLGRLPLEIRLQIWREVLGGNLFHIAFDKTQNALHCYLCQDFSTGVHSHGEDKYPRCQGSLREPCFFYSRPICFFSHGEKYAFRAMSFLLTCRQIYTEAMDILYSTNVFNIDDSTTLLGLMAPPFSHFRHIQTMHVNVAMWKIRCSDITEVAVTPPLYSVWTEFWATLAKFSGLRHLRLDVYGTSRAGFQKEDLEPLLQLKGLKTFDLAVWRDTDGPNYTRQDITVSIPLRDFIRSSIGICN
ncbi:MAG: hypothetical protein Q9182_002543 [Xanthomendoza sp. 2 TL-2023]